MPRGSIAKENIVKQLATAFGEAYIGEYDKKVYLWADDGGEKVQIAISMTCPKVPIVVDNTVSTDDGDWDFSDTPKTPTIAVSSAPPAEITEQEMENLNTLLAKLGL